MLWTLYTSRHPSAAIHHQAGVHSCTLADVRLVAPWVGEAFSDDSRALFPAECGAQIAALRHAQPIVTDRLSGAIDDVLALIGQQLGAAGQPLNLDALRARDQRADEARQMERIQGNDTFLAGSGFGY